MKVLVEKLRLDDPDPDISWLGRFTDRPTPEEYRTERVCKRLADDRYGRYARYGDYEYFVAANSAEDTGNPESVQQDYEQAERYNRLEWDLIGVKVRVTLTDERGFSKVIESPGLWGVWSDGTSGGDGHHEEVAEEQWQEVRDDVYDLAAGEVDCEAAECSTDGRFHYCLNYGDPFVSAEWVEKT